MTSDCGKYDQRLISQTIDWLRFPMAVLVVFIHADGAITNPELYSCRQNGLLDVLTIIFSQGLGRIAVPVFFFISGYLFFKGLAEWKNSAWIDKEKKRVKSLLVPYVLWNLIALVAFVAFWMVKAKMSGTSANPIEIVAGKGWLRIFWDSNIVDAESFTNLFGINMANAFPIDRPLWFLRDLMVLTMIAPVVYLLARYVGKLALAVFGLLMIANIGFPFNANFTIGFFFFLFGAYYMIKGKNFLVSFSKVRILSAVILMASLVGVVLTYHAPSCKIICKSLVNLVALSGLVTVMNISGELLSRGKTKVKDMLSQSTFFIYATQGIYVESLVAIFVKTLPGVSGVMMSAKYFLLVALTVVLLLGLYSLLKIVLPKTTRLLMGSRC